MIIDSHVHLMSNNFIAEPYWDNSGLGYSVPCLISLPGLAQCVVDEALQIDGGIGLIRGSRTERLYRSVRLPGNYEGTSEIQRITIARSIIRGEIDE